jgi:hypothetical protein
VRISFEGGHDEASPRVVVHNPEVLSFACLTQVNRFGLLSDREGRLAGRLRGNRRTLTEMILTYGNNIEYVRPPTTQH